MGFMSVAGLLVLKLLVNLGDIVGCNQQSLPQFLSVSVHSETLQEPGLVHLCKVILGSISDILERHVDTYLLFHFRKRTVGERKRNKPMLSPLISLGFSIARRNASIWKIDSPRLQLQKAELFRFMS